VLHGETAPTGRPGGRPYPPRRLAGSPKSATGSRCCGSVTS